MTILAATGTLDRIRRSDVVPARPAIFGAWTRPSTRATGWIGARGPSIRRQLGAAGAGHSGRSDVSERIEEILAAEVPR